MLGFVANVAVAAAVAVVEVAAVVVVFVLAAVVVAEASLFAAAVATGYCCGELAMGPLETGVGVCCYCCSCCCCCVVFFLVAVVVAEAWLFAAAVVLPSVDASVESLQIDPMKQVWLLAAVVGVCCC